MLIIVGFIIGMTVSGGSIRYFFIQRLAKQQKILDYQFECQPEITTSLVSLRALEKFRANEISSTNAVEYLESQLDYALAGIGRYLSHHPLSERDPDLPAVMAVLRSARQYRDRFPHTNQDFVLQQDVQRAFSVANEHVKP